MTPPPAAETMYGIDAVLAVLAAPALRPARLTRTTPAGRLTDVDQDGVLAAHHELDDNGTDAARRGVHRIHRQGHL